MWKSVRAIAAAGLCAAAVAQAAPFEIEAKCEKAPGLIGGPYIPDARTAEQVYRAVADGVLPGALERFPVVEVEDQGKAWLVSQRRQVPKAKPKPGEIVVSAGGGQLSMKIDKCSGAISEVVANR